MKRGKKPPRATPPRSVEPSWFERLSPLKQDLLAILVLYGLVLGVFHQVVFSDMIFSDSGDTAAHQSWAQASEHLRRAEHVEPLWFPYIFGGMPGFSSLLFPRDVSYAQRVIHLPGQWLFLHVEMSWFVLHYFLAGVFLFLLAKRLTGARLPSLIAACTLMLNPYAIGLTSTGHGSKLVALSYIPLIFLLTHTLFEQRNLLSLGLLAAGIGTMLLSNHVQMAYYGLLLIGSYLLYEVVLNLRSQAIAAVKKTALFAAALALGFGIAAYVYLPVQEYAQYSIRGGGEAGTPGGLSYDYATNWSLHPFELLNYLIPSFFGFSSSYLTDWQGQQQVLPLYWGWMPFTDSSVYVGVLPLLLTIFALLYRRNRMTLFLGLVSILVFLVSFGKHLSVLYDLLFAYLPYFNKFRAPSMMLHLIPITFGLLAAYGMTALMDAPALSRTFNLAALRTRLVVVIAILIGLLVLGSIFNRELYRWLSGFLFVKEGDVQQYGAQVVEVLKEKRFEVFWDDYVKCTLLVCVGLGLVVAYLAGTIRRSAFGVAMLAVLTVDLYLVDLKFIHPRPRAAMDQRFAADATIQALKADTTLYRVFPTGSLFMDNTYMYHLIHSIGGYSPAKLKVYQELIDSCLTRGNTNVIDMLNVKYLLVQQQGSDGSVQTVPQLNPGCLPRAWFVDSVLVAPSKEQVFRILNAPSFVPRRVAVLEKLPSIQPLRPDSAMARVVHYGAHEVRLETFTSRPALLVLSEVYYPAGWKASIDGTETEIYKTNYILRSVVVPGGAHEVVFRFDPLVYRRGFTVTQVAWGVTFGCIIIGVLQFPQVRAKLRKSLRGPHP